MQDITFHNLKESETDGENIWHKDRSLIQSRDQANMNLFFGESSYCDQVFLQ